MKLKKLLLPLIMVMLVLTSTVVFAATLSISAGKTSGQVKNNEAIKYTGKTDSTTVFIQSIGYTITDVATGKELKTQTFPASKSNVQTMNMTAYMPEVAYDNINVRVTLKDKSGNTKTADYKYTMDTKNVFTIDVTPSSGKLTKGQLMSMICTASQNGIGIKNVKLAFKDTQGNVLLDYSTVANDKGLGCGVNKFYLDPMYAPSKVASNVILTVDIDDIRGRTFSKTFNYTMDAGSTPTPTPTGNVITITPNKASGSNINPGEVITFASKGTTKNIKYINFKLYKENPDNLLFDKTINSSYPNGSNPLEYSKTMPTEPGRYRVEIVAYDTDGNYKKEIFYFVIPGSTPTPSSSVAVTYDPVSGSTVEEGDLIKVTGITSIDSDPVVSIRYNIYDADGDKITSKTVTGNTPKLYYNITVPSGIDTRYFTIETVATTVSGVTGSATAKYYLEDYDDDDDDDDDDIYSGYINPDLDGLAIDLWTVEKERMFELDSTINFVAYYYNFDKKDAKNVVIEIEVPDGFTVKSRSTSYGSSQVKNGNIIYKVGTVPSKTLREVRFSLKADDDDLSETAQNIKAIIYRDTDDEEDTSTQRIYIYEVGEKGNRKAFVTGYTDGSFRPDNNITRAEVAAMMARAFNYSAKSVSKTFTDVKTTNWAYKYVAGCYNKNVIKGYTDGSFRPTNKITRAELYAMTFRSMEIDEEEKPLFVPKAYRKETSWDTPYVAGLERLRMIDDMDDLDKDDVATRAEVVYLISRVQFRNTSSFKVNYYNDVTSSYWNAKDIEAASYNYSFTRKSGGKETVKLGTTFLESESNYLK